MRRSWIVLQDIDNFHDFVCKNDALMWFLISGSYTALWHSNLLSANQSFPGEKSADVWEFNVIKDKLGGGGTTNGH